MKHTRTSPTHQPMFIRELKISTRILLHPEFSLKRRAFANRHGVDLVDAPDPETSFTKAPDDPYNQKRAERIKANVHLVRHGAINLFTERDEDGEWIRGIKLGPAMLLHKVERHPLQAGDLPLSLSKLRDKVSPLLADPLDARHIVPGLVQDDEEHVAYWSRVDTECRFPGFDIRCFHGLSHPLTGPAEGTKPKRIQLGDKKDGCVIRFKVAKWDIDGLEGAQVVDGVRVRLILKRRRLTDEFMHFATIAKVNNTKRVVAFTVPDLARLHQAVMARMEGTYLPVPPEWAHMGKPVTRDKAMALISQLTSIPLEELQAMYEEIRHPSESTSKRLRTGAAVAAASLKPVPVFSLFLPDAYANHAAAGAGTLADRGDPLVAAVYG